jgi:DNA replication and repair protein RecF
MAIERLTLADFRSYRAAGLDVGAGFVVLTGENGAGKTNILEAVSLLAPGRGLRGAAFRDMARDGGAGGFAVSARLDGIDFGTGTAADVPDRRIVRINSANASATALAEWLSIVWLTPAMDRLFTDAPGDRRRFLDRLVLARDAGHARHATRYEAAMRQRNRLLAENDAPDADWLSALEAAMAEHGAALADARQRLVSELGVVIDAAPAGPFARAGLSLDGWDTGDLAAILAATRARDAAAGRTLAGPHRQDLIVIHREKAQPAARCSTGEQKALLIGIVLAHAALVASLAGAPPILLLDEVAAHLDPLRRAALFERIESGGGQAWLTGTETALFAEVPTGATRLAVRDGLVVPS